MNVTKQGEKLWLLVKRDSRSAEQIAAAMGIEKSYLPKLYKKDVLPPKPRKKACEVFQVSLSYFLENTNDTSVVAEPTETYTATSPEQAAILTLQTENAALREELRALKHMLEQERATHANLAEAVNNLSKRDKWCG